jgi:hypothetical protein
VWLDATFGSWEEPYVDRLTFSCRISDKGAALVDAVVARSGKPSFLGIQLT